MKIDAAYSRFASELFPKGTRHSFENPARGHVVVRQRMEPWRQRDVMPKVKLRSGHRQK